MSGTMPFCIRRRSLKGLLNLERLWQAEVADLPREFPPLDTLDSIANNLPAMLTDFIGRPEAISEVEAALKRHRLVTLTGPGGTGKTRLALQVGADVLDRFREGVWFVELAPIVDEALVPQVLIDDLGIQEQAERSVRQVLIDYVKDKCMLVIFDNCEHLLQACSELVAEIAREAPEIKILISSRERLHLGGEMTYQVPSLSLPDPKTNPPKASLVEYDAVRLFIDRAVAAQPAFRVTDQNAPALVEVCHGLDGIPLAIELAAVRVRALSMEGIA